MAMTTIRPVSGEAGLESARVLLREYAASLGFSLDFQGFDAELAALPGKYAPPSGVMLLATVDGEAAGIVALRALDQPGICEMKRLYVRPAYRALKLGRALADAIVAEARRLGYRAMRLDTIPASMGRAEAMYRRMGFVEIAPYTANPVDGATFLELTLRDSCHPERSEGSSTSSDPSVRSG